MTKREKSVAAFLVVLIVALFFISLFVGEYSISPTEIKAILFGGEVSDIKRQAFLRLRLPRTIMVVLAGFGLSLAGSVFQTVFRNPLAAQDIIGVTGGANLGAAVSIILFGTTSFVLPLSAFAGGLIAVGLLVLLVHFTGGRNISTYLLAGILIKSIAEAGIMTLKFFADPEKELAAIEYWAMGSFSNITSTKLLGILPFFVVGMLGLLLLRRQIYLLAISDDESRSLGVRVDVMRMAILGCATLVVASVICVTGLIRFIGLTAPHIARLIMKKDDFFTTLLAGMVGTVILLASDCVVRSIHTATIPISIITTLVGAPFLAFYLFRQREATE